jgi:hypothetical protein
MIILGVITGLAFLLALAHTIRFVSRKNDERDWIAMKSKTERKQMNELALFAVLY